jgi:hypothetical protein
MNGLHLFLLHGLGSHPITLFPLKIYLMYIKGFTNVHNIEYSVDNVDINDSINDANEKMARLCNKEINEIIIIGQSMGGVIASKLHTKGWKIKKIITIGSPLHGARILNQLNSALPSWISNFLRRNSYTYLMTKEKEKEPPHDYHTISMSWPFTDFDGCVYKDEAMFTKDEAMFTKEKHTHLKWADHRTIFTNPRLWITVGNLIK